MTALTTANNEIDMVEPLVRELTARIGPKFTVVSSGSLFPPSDSGFKSIRPDVVVYSKANGKPVFIVELKGSTSVPRLPVSSMGSLRTLFDYSSKNHLPVMVVSFSRLTDSQHEMLGEYKSFIKPFSDYDDLVKSVMERFRSDVIEAPTSEHEGNK